MVHRRSSDRTNSIDGPSWLGATSATQVLLLAGLAYAIVQTVTFLLYLYLAEIYPTCLRAIGTGTGSAWLRLGSSAGLIAVGWVMSSMGVQYVFATFAAILLVGALVTPSSPSRRKTGYCKSFRRDVRKYQQPGDLVSSFGVFVRASIDIFHALAAAASLRCNTTGVPC